LHVVSRSTAEITEITEKNHRFTSVHSVCSVVNVNMINDAIHSLAGG